MKLVYISISIRHNYAKAAATAPQDQKKKSPTKGQGGSQNKKKTVFFFSSPAQRELAWVHFCLPLEHSVTSPAIPPESLCFQRRCP